MKVLVISRNKKFHLQYKKKDKENLINLNQQEWKDREAHRELLQQRSGMYIFKWNTECKYDSLSYNQLFFEITDQKIRFQQLRFQCSYVIESSEALL